MQEEKQKRIRYSKEFKRWALRVASSGKSNNDILRASGFDIEPLIKKDKKYASKLLHKWRKEIFENSSKMHISSMKLTDEVIKDEIESMYFDDDVDEIMLGIREEGLTNLKDYKKRKNYEKKIVFSKRFNIKRFDKRAFF